jgi:hypothetical protein
MDGILGMSNPKMSRRLRCDNIKLNLFTEGVACAENNSGHPGHSFQIPIAENPDLSIFG